VTPPRIVIRPAAARDVDDQAEYLSSQASEQVANRFLDGVNQAIQDAARMPAIGSPYPLSNPRLQGLRSCQARGRFRQHIIFYLPTDDGIEVVRVLRGSRDLQSILEAEG
jgi:toxin ParE1/3/4